LTIWDNLEILLQLDDYKLTSVSPPPRLKKEVHDTTDRPRDPTLGVGRRDPAIVTTTTTLLFRPWLKRGGENEVVQPLNPAANATANPIGNAANAAGNLAGNNANNAANTAGAQQQNAAGNIGQNAGAQPPPAQATCARSN
jgi:hypothetical protein